MTPAEVAELPVEVLADIQHELTERSDATKLLKAIFDSALQAKYDGAAGAIRLAMAKDSGRVTIGDNGYSIIHDVPKRVKWDQTLLATKAAEIKAAGDDPDEYVKTEFKVEEAKYKAWPERIAAHFEPARTLVTGKPVIRIEAAKREAA
jgi:hypothetical protein